MEILINKTADGITARFVGRLDTLAAQNIAPDVNALCEAASESIVLDCTDMTYISSSGLRVFLTIRKAAAQKGGKILLKGIRDDIRNVFMITGFLSLFDIQ